MELNRISRNSYENPRRERGKLCNMENINEQRVRLEYFVSTKALIGFHGEFTTITKGTGIFRIVLQSMIRYHRHQVNERTAHWSLKRMVLLTPMLLENTGKR